MITTALINFAYYLLSGITALLPQSSGFPPEVGTAFTYVGGYVKMLDPLIPIATLGTAVSIVISVELLILGFRMLEWIYKKIPIIGK